MYYTADLVHLGSIKAVPGLSTFAAPDDDDDDDDDPGLVI